MAKHVPSQQSVAGQETGQRDADEQHRQRIDSQCVVGEQPIDRYHRQTGEQQGQCWKPPLPTEQRATGKVGHQAKSNRPDRHRGGGQTDPGPFLFCQGCGGQEVQRDQQQADREDTPTG